MQSEEQIVTARATTASEPGERDAREPIRTLRKSAYPGLAGKAMLLLARAQTRRWDEALGRMRFEQERVLQDIVSHAKDTAFGRSHGFGALARERDLYREYARRVPVGDYDAFSPFIDRMRQGEKNLLVPEFVRYFGNSSGSSNQGKPKFLPITEKQVGIQRKAGTDGLFRTLSALDDDEFPTGFTLGLFPPTTMREEGPVLITSNPALMVTKLPLVSKPAYLPDDECKVMTDYDAKLARIAEKYIDHDIRALAGTTCWFTLMFEKVLAEAKKRGRSARTIREIWPNLRILLGGGVSADPYLPVIREMMGRSDLFMVDSYNATEGGIYASQDPDGCLGKAHGMLMQPHRGTFFEFLPLDSHHDVNAQRVPLWEVEIDKPYAIVVTTVSGLYSYKLGDIVRFPRRDRIEFQGRLTGCLSVTQELTTHVEIEKAVAHAIEKVPCTTVDFGCSADVGAKSRYVLFAEFSKHPSDLKAFARAFDEGMCAENRVYREHRIGDAALLPPIVVPLRAHGAKGYLDEITRGNMQGKFPRIIDPAKKGSVMAYAESRPSSTLD